MWKQYGTLNNQEAHFIGIFPFNCGEDNDRSLHSLEMSESRTFQGTVGPLNNVGVRGNDLPHSEKSAYNYHGGLYPRTTWV